MPAAKNPPEPLDVGQLCTACDLSGLDFATTAELEPIELPVGQDRAVGALQFAIRMAGDGYNVFAMGPAGLGKQAAATELAAREAGRRPIPNDWIYVNNFVRPQQPRALPLPPGQGQALSKSMDQVVDDLQSAIQASFESEDYRNRTEEMEAELKERQSDALHQLGEEARSQKVALLHTPGGFAFAPLSAEGEVIAPEDFAKLPAAERKQIQQTIRELQEKLQALIRQFPVWAREARQKIKELNRENATYAVGHLIDTLRDEYVELAQVRQYLDQVQTDIIDNVALFLGVEEGEELGRLRGSLEDPLQRYRVNLLVDNSALDAAPVVYEELPGLPNLVGRIEHEARMGALVTDFTHIKAGALHRANGGFLLLDARDLLLQPFAWEGLKRALRTGQIRIEEPERMLGLFSTVSLEPDRIPLGLKVVLLGDRLLYYLLQELDPDFDELFKVAADFEESVDRDRDSALSHARLCAAIVRRNELRPVSRAAVARFIEHAARIAGDAAKLTTRLGDLGELLREADHWAAEAGREAVEPLDVDRAIEQQRYRAGRIHERVLEQIRRGTLLIDIEGERVGQVNGLSVVELGHGRFGQPSRITARTRLGEGEVVDIERETELGGSIHSKGVLILASFLGSHYAPELPLSVSASLVFEQSYGMVEGDSASVAELCALLSSLSDLPIRQSLAVTGSVNQLGRIQAIGGVNEKVEGFFEVCRAIGLNGEQGVVIPASNVKHLMLRRELIDTVAAGEFRVYAVDHVDQAIALLTGVPAGEPDGNGNYPLESVSGRVRARLRAYAEARRDFGARASSTTESAPNDQ